MGGFSPNFRRASHLWRAFSFVVVVTPRPIADADVATVLASWQAAVHTDHFDSTNCCKRVFCENLLRTVFRRLGPESSMAISLDVAINGDSPGPWMSLAPIVFRTAAWCPCKQHTAERLGCPLTAATILWRHYRLGSPRVVLGVTLHVYVSVEVLHASEFSVMRKLNSDEADAFAQ